MKKNILIRLLLIIILLPNFAFGEVVEFSDIKGIEGEEAIKNLLEKGIVEGVTKDKFMPEEILTRAEMLTMLKRLEKLDDKYIVESKGQIDFIDVKPDSWYKEVVDWASGGNIVKGIGNNKFAPNRELTREELGVIVYDYIGNSGIEAIYIEPWQIFDDEGEISSWASGKVNTMCTNNIMLFSGENFRPKDKVTRAEAAMVIQNILKKW